MANKRDSIVLRFGIVYFAIVFLFSLILYRIIVLQFVERDQLLALADKNVRTDIKVRPKRGNIFACDGRLMASSIPTYYIYMDTRVPALHLNNGELFKEKIDSVSQALSDYFKDRSASGYKNLITQAYNHHEGSLQLYPQRISYSQLKDLRKMPLFRMGSYKSGLITRQLLRRVKPFGMLASRTIGEVYADETKGGGRSGLELYFNKQLTGTPGIATIQKVANKWEETVQVPPVDGLDIETTIDVDLQDITERALLDGVHQFGAAQGYAILMEAKTGEVKAIANLQRNSDGTYSENRNGCVSNLTEPGSTFKTVSLMALLDQGKGSLDDTIDTKDGHFRYFNRIMTDHNANHGGYHVITLAQAIYGSSNIGVSREVMKAYGDDPAAYVNKLYEMKINQPFDLEIPGTAAPYIRSPNDKSHYWSATTLPWMAIGYETQIPPIYTLAFYNAIANNGKYIQPYFVKAIMKDGDVVKSFQAKVINPQICKPSTLAKVKFALLGVVENKMGTAQNVKSNVVRIAGKSGTAQISEGKAGYKEDGHAKHQVSFVGFFPYKHPLYTCIVVMVQPSIGYPAGGAMSGSVFKKIAEETMSLKYERKIADLPKDTINKIPFFPVSKSGNMKALHNILHTFDIKTEGVKSQWVNTHTSDSAITTTTLLIKKQQMPKLIDLGAKDAMYLAAKLGLDVRMTGKGRVIRQSIRPGSYVNKGQSILITLKE